MRVCAAGGLCSSPLFTGVFASLPSRACWRAPGGEAGIGALSLVLLPIPPLSQVSLNDQPELNGSNSGQHKSKAVLDLVYRVEDRFSAGRPGAARGYRLRGCAAPPELL